MSEFYVDLNILKQEANSLETLKNEILQMEIKISLLKILNISYSESTRIVEQNLKLAKESLKVYRSNVSGLNEALSQILEIYKKYEDLIIGDVPQTTRNRIKDSTETKDAYINEVEKEHPEYKQMMDDYFNEFQDCLTEEDKRNIKYLIYTAEEPYRSIYIKNIKNFDVAEMKSKGTYYSPSNKTLHYNYKKDFKKDPRGAYTTLFHESGHCIDDTSNLTNGPGFDTKNYTFYNEGMGKNTTLQESITYDVYYNKNNPHSITSIAEGLQQKGGLKSKGNIDNVINAMQNGNKENLNSSDRALYNAVVNKYNSEFSGKEANYESVTDIYGGVSHNTLKNDAYGHNNNYWDTRDPSTPSQELWAEYFSYNMAGDTKNLEYLREYFPETAKGLDSYALQLERQ